MYRYVYVCICMYVYVYVGMYVRMYVCMYVCRYVRVYIYIWFYSKEKFIYTYLYLTIPSHLLSLASKEIRKVRWVLPVWPWPSDPHEAAGNAEEGASETSVLEDHPPNLCGGFLKWGYPQITYFNGIFPQKNIQLLGYPYLWKPPGVTTGWQQKHHVEKEILQLVGRSPESPGSKWVKPRQSYVDRLPVYPISNWGELTHL